MNFSQNNSNMGQNPYTNQTQGFVRVYSKPSLNYLSLTMNPTSKGDSILILFLLGFTNPNFKQSKVMMKFYQNPRFGDKLLTIQNLKIPSFHTIPYSRLVSIPFCLISLLIFFSSSSSSSSSLLFPLHDLFFSQMRPIFGLKSKNIS